jgi:hypothetical protein
MTRPVRPTALSCRVSKGRQAERVIKTCACGRSYTQADWATLPDAIVYQATDEVHEQRLCACGSHIVIVIGAPAPADS